MTSTNGDRATRTCPATATPPTDLDLVADDGQVGGDVHVFDPDGARVASVPSSSGEPSATWPSTQKG